MASTPHRPPPTVMVKPDSLEPFGEKICINKLRKVGRTSDAIRKTAAWIFHHRDRMQQFVKIWLAEFKKASPSRRLTLYYVAHETLALCKKRKFDKGFTCFQSVLREATVYSRDRECKMGVRKVFNIFADAAFFPEEFLRSLREDLERGKSSSNFNKTVLMDFDPAVINSIHEHMEEFREPGLKKLEGQYAGMKADNVLETGPTVISKIKEHSMGKEYLRTFDGAFITMTELLEAREQDLKHEYDLLNQLELLRVFYSTTTKEADKVIVAYRNYEYAAQIGLKHLEKAQALLGIPMPRISGAKSTPAAVIATADSGSEVMDMEMSDEEDTAVPEKKEPRRSALPSPDLQPLEIQMPSKKISPSTISPSHSVTTNITSMTQKPAFIPAFSSFTSPHQINSSFGGSNVEFPPQQESRSEPTSAFSLPFPNSTNISLLGHPGGFRPSLDPRPPIPLMQNHPPEHRLFSPPTQRHPGGFESSRFTPPANFEQNGGNPNGEQHQPRNSGPGRFEPGPERFPLHGPRFDQFPGNSQFDGRFRSPDAFNPRNANPSHFQGNKDPFSNSGGFSRPNEFPGPRDLFPGRDVGENLNRSHMHDTESAKGIFNGNNNLIHPDGGQSIAARLTSPRMGFPPRSSFGTPADHRPTFRERFQGPPSPAFQNHDGPFGSNFTPGMTAGSRFIRDRSPEGIHRLGSRFNTPSSPVFRNNDRPLLDTPPIKPSSALREIPMSTCPESSPNLPTTPKPTALNFDEDNFDQREANEPEEPNPPQPSFLEEKRPPLLQFHNPAEVPHPGHPIHHRFEPPARPLLPSFPPGQNHHFSPGLLSHPPPPFRPDYHPVARPFHGQSPPFPQQQHPPVDFHRRERSPPSPRGQNFLPQPNLNRFSQPRASHEEPLPRHGAGGDLINASRVPVEHDANLGIGAGSSGETISLTERLRRLAESQTASSNIVLTSSGGGRGGGGGGKGEFHGLGRR